MDEDYLITVFAVRALKNVWVKIKNGLFEYSLLIVLKFMRK